MSAYHKIHRDSVFELIIDYRLNTQSSADIADFLECDIGDIHKSALQEGKALFQEYFYECYAKMLKYFH